MRLLVLTIALAAPAVLAGQSLGDRIRAVDGLAQFTFPPRPEVCGDGRGEIRNVIGNERDGGSSSVYVDDSGERTNGRRCVHGPARVIATVIRGEVTRLRMSVGPVSSDADDMRGVDVGAVTASQAREWLAGLMEHGATPVAKDAMVSLLVADGPPAWSAFVKVADNDERPGDVRRQAMFWLAQGASATLDASAPRDESDESELGTAAVFGLSQQRRDVAVPALIDAVATGKNAHIRAAAIFWLGQTGDVRGVPLFAKLLGVTP